MVATKKMSPKRERKERMEMSKVGSYAIMALYFLLLAAAVTASVSFVVFSILEARKFDEPDTEETRMKQQDRRNMSYEGAVISLLGCILLLCAWMAYNVHKHYN